MKLFSKIAIAIILFCLLGKAEAQEKGTFWVDFTFNSIIGVIDNNSTYIAVNYDNTELIKVLRNQLPPPNNNVYKINKSKSFQTGNNDFLSFYVSPNNIIYTGLSSSFYFTLPYSNLKNQDLGMRSNGFGTNANITVQPYSLNLYYLDSNGVFSSTREIPSADKITIKATTFDYPSLYKWEYKIDVLGGNGNENWMSIPTTCEKNNRKEITFSGIDILSTLTAFKEMIDQNKYIFIRINSTSKIPGTILRLNPRVSAPHIVGTPSSTSPTCNGGSDGRIDITFDRKVENYENVTVSYRTTGSPVYNQPSLIVPAYSTTYSIVGLGSGSYDIKIKGACNNESEFSDNVNHKRDGIPVDNYGILYVSVTNQVPPKCFGGTGSVTVSPKGGAGGYTIRWDDTPSNTSMTRNDLKAGAYNYTVTDKAGCYKDSTVTITQPDNPLEIKFTESKSCKKYGSSDGTATVEIAGGSLSYPSIVWTGINTAKVTTTSIAGNKSTVIGTAGFYNLEVIDSYGCSKQLLNVEIKEPAELKVSVAILDMIKCTGDDGKIIAYGEGGVRPYTYKWYNTLASATPIANAVDSVLTCKSGTYFVEIKDANEIFQKSNNQQNIESQSLLRVQKVGTTWCKKNDSSDGTATVQISGGTSPYIISWTDDSNGAIVTPTSADKFTITNKAGSYTVMVTDAKGCIKSSQLRIDAPKVLSVSIAALSAIKCTGDDGKIIAYGEGGVRPYTYKWYNTIAPSTPIANAVDSVLTCKHGIYFVKITDANEIHSPLSNNIDLSESAIALSVDSVSSTSATGYAKPNGSAQMKIQGGTRNYVLSWINPLGQVIDIANILNDATNSNEYISTIQNQVAGKYTLNVTDARGCVKSKTITISQPYPLKITMNMDSIKCKDDFGTLSASVIGGVKPYSYKWFHDNGTGYEDVNCVDSILKCKYGVYKVVVVDKNLNSDSISNELIDPELLTVSLQAEKIKCFGTSTGRIDATPKGGTKPYTYLWNTGDKTTSLSDIKSGQYSVIVTDYHGCQAKDTVIVAESDSIKVTTYPTDVSCNGGGDGKVQFKVSGGTGTSYKLRYKSDLDVNWKYLSNNFESDATVQNLVKDIYYFVVEDAIGCSSREQAVPISQPSHIRIDSLSSVSAKGYGLENGKAKVSITGGTHLAQGTYSLVWKNSVGTRIISNDTLSVDGKTLYSTIENRAGKYELVVADQNNCPDSLSITIYEPDSINVDIQMTAPIKCAKGYGTLVAHANGGVKNTIQESLPYNCKWYNNDSLDLIIKSTTDSTLDCTSGFYFVTITDANGNFKKSNLFEIKSPEELKVRIITTDVSVDSENNGAVEAIPAGGTGKYTYLWDTPKSDTTRVGRFAKQKIFYVHAYLFIKKLLRAIAELLFAPADLALNG